MKVLLSIKPEFASKIFDGSKRYEYRRSIFANKAVTSVIVYATAPVGQVIGEFEIEDILHEEISSLWARTQHHAGISGDRFFEYFANKSTGYAIKVKAPQAYDNPRPLSSFKVSIPPQSYMYLR